MHGFRRYTALLLLVAALALTVTACSGGGGSDSGDDTGGGSKTFTSDQYGFSITYDTQLTEGEPLEGSGAGGSSVFDVIFADKDGAMLDDRYVDAIQVSVYELAREVEPSELPQLKSELDSVVEQMMGSLSEATIVEPLTEITVNDVPGFALKYTYTQDGTELTAVTYFLVKGKYEYQISAQATTENWEALKGTLEAAVNSFTAP